VLSCLQLHCLFMVEWTLERVNYGLEITATDNNSRRRDISIIKLSRNINVAIQARRVEFTRHPPGLDLPLHIIWYE
jgi:hypothetical protein